MSGPRLFVAIAIPDGLRRALGRAAGELAGSCAELRPRVVPREQLHLTLRFFGAGRGGRTARRLEVELRRRLSRLPVDPVRLRMSGIGAFPSVGRARVAWAGLGEGDGSGRLGLLQRSTEGAARKLGFEAARRRFRPHVTLARLRNPGPIPAAVLRAMEEEVFGGGPAPEFAARRVHLIASTLSPAGARHERLAAIRFGSSGVTPVDANPDPGDR